MTRALLVGFVSILGLALYTGSASAARGLAVTNGINVAVAQGNVVMNAGGINENCLVRLRLNINSPINKAVGAVIGTVQPSPASTITNCQIALGGTVLPGINVLYAGFVGVLPNIAAINATANALFLLQYPAPIGSCLYTGNVSVRFNRNGITGAITSVDITAAGLVADRAICPAPAALNGNLPVQPVQPIVQLI